jgi:hypothetical protein
MMTVKKHELMQISDDENDSRNNVFELKDNSSHENDPTTYISVYPSSNVSIYPKV